MHTTNLAGVDLNLLVALEAMLDERNVTRAAQRVGLSQPAMSRALGRLRALFADPLFVRTSKGMAPTARAVALSGPLKRALAELEGVIRSPTFDPETARGRMRIAATDYAAVIVLPRVIGRYFAEAPHFDMEILPMDYESLAGLEAGDMDLAIGVFTEAPAGIYRQRLFTEDFACVVRAGHPVLRKKLTPEVFSALPHGLVTVLSTHKGNLMDAVVKHLGGGRRFALRLPHFLAAALIVAESDLILTLPRRLALRFAELAGLVLIDPPVRIAKVSISQLWHERHHHDPAHIWLRALMAEQTRDL